MALDAVAAKRLYDATKHDEETQKEHAAKYVKQHIEPYIEDCIRAGLSSAYYQIPWKTAVNAEMVVQILQENNYQVYLDYVGYKIVAMNIKWHE